MMHIDARGLRCPWPAVRLAKALRQGADAVTIAADDPQAPAELALVAAAADADMSINTDAVAPTFVVTRRPVGNTVFTQSP